MQAGEHLITTQCAQTEEQGSGRARGWTRPRATEVLGEPKEQLPVSTWPEEGSRRSKLEKGAGKPCC